MNMLIIEAKILEGVVASLARKKPFRTVGYDALNKLCSSIAARSKDLLASLWQTCAKKAWDQVPTFILRGICVLFPDVDLAFAIELIIGAPRNPWKISHNIDSFVAARYPWLISVIAYCCYTTLATLLFVFIFGVHSGSLSRGVPHALGRGNLLTKVLVLFPWIRWAVVM